ncbi:uncharacterized protein BDZ83DRAFT_722249 [Colletotrichum acutatum]|uniref:Uncharacterized protein n=1 Tax=Glomerella acutata TaxID=27357 RepID=A0AAD8XF83_GLOAC|nr:uncharacterized protein BDZ83DRAFT_722249 [Colletotrichum acutatum]KAK1718890.1 hypothetical protein BDZ83DRAFT_722249 [Colletotrichum acutatum]
MYSHSSRSGSHKHGRKGEKKEKGHKPRESSSKQDILSCSFLFVVNELQILEGHDNVDIYGNILPPNSADGYGKEIAGLVWRYENGVVSQAGSEFIWHRPDVGSPGGIWGPTGGHFDVNGTFQPDIKPMMEYQTCSVFNCWRFLPCRFTDVDVSTVDDPFWHNLEFHQDRPNTGITRIIVPGGSQRHVVGRNPSWIPHILPDIFATPDPAAPQSTGLGGSFAIIIALLALTTRHERMDDVFLQGQWNRHQWTGSRCPQADPDPMGSPRGVMVHVCYDSYNINTNSTLDAIGNFERQGCAIKDRR